MGKMVLKVAVIVVMRKIERKRKGWLVFHKALARLIIKNL